MVEFKGRIEMREKSPHISQDKTASGVTSEVLLFAGNLHSGTHILSVTRM